MTSGAVTSCKPTTCSSGRFSSSSLLNQGSRKVVHLAATRNPTQEWTAQQLRNATMEGLTPRFLIRDRDEKFGAKFDCVAEGVGTRVIKTAVRAPNMNPVGERFVGSLRREALDHVLLLGDEHLENVARQYVLYFNKARPHQGIGQRIPDAPANDNHDGKIIAIPVLGGLHHDYQRAARSLAIPADRRGSHHAKQPATTGRYMRPQKDAASEVLKAAAAQFRSHSGHTEPSTAPVASAILETKNPEPPEMIRGIPPVRGGGLEPPWLLTASTSNVPRASKRRSFAGLGGSGRARKGQRGPHSGRSSRIPERRGRLIG